MKANQRAFEIGQMAERIAAGYYPHIAAIQIAQDPPSVSLSPGAELGILIPEGRVFRRDGTFHRFHFDHFLAKVGNDPAIIDELTRVWLVGALLTLGDALTANVYFDRAPELELLRHLRNGVAHGNAFRIDNPQSLNDFPAHNKLAWVKSDTGAEFEITPNLQGQRVLFDFMGPGDILDLIVSVGLYLIRTGNGDSPHP
jgi:hypothetical protein